MQPGELTVLRLLASPAYGGFLARFLGHLCTKYSFFFFFSLFLSRKLNFKHTVPNAGIWLDEKLALSEGKKKANFFCGVFHVALHNWEKKKKSPKLLLLLPLLKAAS